MILEKIFESLAEVVVVSNDKTVMASAVSFSPSNNIDLLLPTPEVFARN
jgi:hypothetical protein